MPGPWPGKSPAGRGGRSWSPSSPRPTSPAALTGSTAPTPPGYAPSTTASSGCSAPTYTRSSPTPRSGCARVHLLRAVAFAYGRGLPWAQIWPLVANAVADRPGTYGDNDIVELLASRIGGYLVTDQEDGVTVYRLFHDALRTTLRERSSRSARPRHAMTSHSSLPPRPPSGRSTRAVERRIATELARLASPTEVAGQQLAPPPYLRRHLAEHAAAGDVLNDHTLPRDFLPYLDLPRLRAAITSTAGGLTALPALRRATHQWDFNQPHSNEVALQLWAAALKTPIDTATHPQTQWHVIWANWPIGHSEILGKHTSAVIAVTALVLPDGRPVAVTGGGDGTVRVWDLATGAPIGDPLTGHTGPVDAVAVPVLPDGRPSLVTGSRRRHGAGVGPGHRHPDRRHPHRPHRRGGRGGRAVLPDGTPGRRHRQRRRHGAGVGPGHRHPDRRHPHRPHRPGDGGGAAPPDGRPSLVTGSGDGTVRVWDLATGTPIGDPLTGHTGAVAAVAHCAARRPPGRGHRQRRRHGAGVGPGHRRPDRRPPHRPHRRGGGGGAAPLPTAARLAVTGSRGRHGAGVGPGHRHPDRRHPHRPHRPGGGGGAAPPDGRPVAVTGSDDDTVRVWDLATGTPIGDPLTGHTGAVAAVAHRPPDGRPLAVTGSDDGTVRVWDLATGTADRRHPHRPHRPGGGGGRARCPTAARSPSPAAATTRCGCGTWPPAPDRRPPHRPHRLGGGGGALALPDGRPVAVTGSDDRHGAGVGPGHRHHRSATPHRPHRRGGGGGRAVLPTAARSPSPAAGTARCGCGISPRRHRLQPR